MNKAVGNNLSCLFFTLAVFFFTKSTNAQTFNLPSNYLKISVAPIFVGEVNFNYERLFKKKISSELGFGFVTDNYLKSFLSESITSKSGKTLIGPSVGGVFKYYPFSKGDELYLCAEFKYRRYRKLYSQDGGSITFYEYTQRMIPRVGVGYHYFMDEHLFIDFSGNLGLVFEKSRQYGNDLPINDIKLNFGIGLKFGYAF